MTRRILGMACLAIVLLGVPARVEALGWRDVWDALDALSGPGPFDGNPGVAATVLCFTNDGEVSWFATVPEPDQKHPCLYVDFRAVSVGPKAPYDTVTAALTETGFTWEIWHFLEYGAGVGTARFESKGIVTNNFTFTPVRIVFKPLRLIPKWKHSQRAASLKYFIRETVRFGKLTGNNFGVPRESLDVGTEGLTSAGVVVDVVQLIRGK